MADRRDRLAALRASLASENKRHRAKLASINTQRQLATLKDNPIERSIRMGDLARQQREEFSRHSDAISRIQKKISAL